MSATTANLLSRLNQFRVDPNDIVITKSPVSFHDGWHINALVTYLGQLFTIQKIYMIPNTSPETYRKYVTIVPIHGYREEDIEITVGLDSLELAIPEKLLTFKSPNHALFFKKGDRVGERSIKMTEHVRNYVNRFTNDTILYHLDLTPIEQGGLRRPDGENREDLMRLESKEKRIDHRRARDHLEDMLLNTTTANKSPGEKARDAADRENYHECEKDHDDHDHKEQPALNWDFRSTDSTKDGWRNGQFVAYDHGLYTIIAVRAETLLLTRMHGHPLESTREADKSLCMLAVPQNVMVWRTPHDAVRMQPRASISIMNLKSFSTLRQQMYLHPIPDRVTYELNQYDKVVARKDDYNYYLVAREDMDCYADSDYPSDGYEDNFQGYETSENARTIQRWREQKDIDIPSFITQRKTIDPLTNGLDERRTRDGMFCRSAIYGYKKSALEWIEMIEGTHGDVLAEGKRKRDADT